LIWALGKSKPVQTRINFAASYFPSLDEGERTAAK
jgi:hypothetical protein